MRVAVFLLLGFGVAFCEVDSLVYDDGVPVGYFTSLRAGDIEAVRFTPLHPCSLKGFSVLVRNYSSAPSGYEFHIWWDNGGQMPDTARDIIAPISGITSGGSVREWVRIDLSDYNIVIPPLVDFHIGHKVQTNGVQFFVDNSAPTVQRSTLRIGTNWYVSGDGDYILRAYIVYFDSIRSEARMFEDVTARAGLTRGGSRVAWGDYNNDGYDDLLVDGHTLWRNNGDGTFTDVTLLSGIDSSFTNGGIWADYNNDGYLDFYAHAWPPHMDILWRNNGDGTFTDATGEANFPGDSYPTEAVAWVDIDNDGFVDLYVANYERPDSMAVGTPDYLWRNNGDGTFSDVSVSSGIRSVATRCGRGVNPCDFNMDGYMDIYVSNYRLNPNFLWVNDGTGHFTNYARDYGVEGIRRYSGGVPYWGHTIGSEWADFDNDLDFDLFTANLAHPRFLAFSDISKLYRNDGPPDYTFHDMFDSSGIIYQETHSDPAWGDIDNDGDLDLFITCVYSGRRSFFYRNDGGGRFTEISYETGVVVDGGWGCAFSDYDRDGFLDLVAGGGFSLWHNRGNSNHFVEIKLEGRLANRSAIGSIVKLYAGELKQMRQVEGGKGTSSQNSLTLHFGLASHTSIDSIVILWQGSGTVDRYRDLQADNFYTAVEGTGISITGVKNVSEVIPAFEIFPPYPNPFNSRAQIDYYLGANSKLKIELFDILGRKIRTLFEGPCEKGKHRLVLDTHICYGLTSGVYFIYFNANGQRRYERLVILK